MKRDGKRPHSHTDMYAEGALYVQVKLQEGLQQGGCIAEVGWPVQWG